MKNLKSKRYLLAILTLALAAIFLFVIQPLLVKPAAAVPAIRLTRDVSKGELITDDMLKAVSVSSDAIHKQIIQKKEDLIGSYALHDLYLDDMVNRSAITQDISSLQNTLYSVSSGKELISVTVKSLASGLSGKLETGDIVTIYSIDEEKDKQAVLYKELKYVKVVGITNQLSNEVDPTAAVDVAGKLPATVILEVNTKQAMLLTKLENSNVLHFTLVYRGTQAQANEYLISQERMME